jgi:hypothetical protein
MDLKAEVAKQLHEAQGKYTYFILAVTAASMAFSIRMTDGDSLARNHFLLGAALLCWGGSFFAGCKNREHHGATLFANLALLDLGDGTHPNTPPNNNMREVAMEGVLQAAEQNSTNANTWGRRQFRLLVLGAVFFLAWHTVEMKQAQAEHKNSQPVEICDRENCSTK